MAARAIWKGTIVAGKERLPVKLYSAVQERGVHFRLLDPKGKAPVRQKMVEPDDGDEVAADATRRGYEVEPGTFVVLDEEDLAALEPPASRDIEVLRFVPAGAIGQVWYDRPYWLGPDDGASADYFALAAALRDAGREGVVRWVMRKKHYLGALRPEGEHLALVTLHPTADVVDIAELAPRGGRPFSDRELEMAEQLVDALVAPFEHEEYRDTYRDKVLELVAARAEGKPVKLAKLRPRKPTEDSLADALAASLGEAKQRRARAS